MPTKAKFQIGDPILCPGCSASVHVIELRGRGRNRKAILTCRCAPWGSFIRDLSKDPSRANVDANQLC